MKKILLVDNEERLRRLVRITLGDDFDILEASDGLEAVQLAGNEMPDLIFLDIGMPGMDGFAACDAIKKNPLTGHIPVVMLTGHEEREFKERGRVVGADEYFVKPFSPRALLDKVYEVLGEP